MATEHFKQGEVIFREGDRSREAYFIIRGRVEIAMRAPHAADGSQSLASIGDGEIFGEMGMITDRPRSATAIAVEDTTVETIGDDDFEQQIIQRPERLHVYLATLYERIRDTDLLLNAAGDAAVNLSREDLKPPAEQHQEDLEPSLRAILRSRYDETGFKYEPVDRTISKLPFRIGRSHFDINSSAATRNDLSIKEGVPCQLSRQHCELDLENGRFVLRDLGSKLGSLVNGRRVLAEAGSSSCLLELGDNEVIFGSPDSPHQFTITIEEVEEKA